MKPASEFCVAFWGCLTCSIAASEVFARGAFLLLAVGILIAWGFNLKK